MDNKSVAINTERAKHIAPGVDWELLTFTMYNDDGVYFDNEIIILYKYGLIGVNVLFKEMEYIY